MNGRLLLILVLTAQSSIFASEPAEILLLKGLEAAAHNRISLPTKEKATVTTFTDYVRVNYLYRAFLVLQLLSQRRIENKFYELLSPVLMTNKPDFVSCFFEYMRAYLTPERLRTAFYFTLYQDCAAAEPIAYDFYSATLNDQQRADLQHNILTFASYQGDSTKVEVAIEWLRMHGRDLNTAPSRGVGAHRNWRVDNERKPIGSELVAEHSLPLNAAAEVSEVAIMNLLIQAGADPLAEDLKGESALSLLKRKLDALYALKADLKTKELTQLWQEERDRTRTILRTLCRIGEAKNKTGHPEIVLESNGTDENTFPVWKAFQILVREAAHSRYQEERGRTA